MTSTVHRLAALRDRAVTADAVYGTILFAAVIAVASDDDHPGSAQEPLVLGALGVLPGADEWALWSAVLILATLGYAAFAERGSRLWARLVGAAATAVLGVVIIALDAALH